MPNLEEIDILRAVVDFDNQKLNSIIEKLEKFQKTRSQNLYKLIDEEKEYFINKIKFSFYKSFGKPLTVEGLYNYFNSLFLPNILCKENLDELFLLCQEKEFLFINNDKISYNNTVIIEYNQNLVLKILKELPEQMKNCIIQNYIDKNKTPPTTLNKLVNFLKNNLEPKKIFSNKTLKKEIKNSNLFKIEIIDNVEQVKYNF